ncbi:phoenix [Mastacembelus armatus]|uniref:phoenix n=1 Tax=Mastacembelus armatus TaxID=205130 RepID=UPI000E457760|nr:titin homolog [Mastacembelus armatus]
MTGMHNNSLNWAAAIEEVASAESCHFVLETSPPDYVSKISRYLGSPVGQSGQGNDAAGAESDSGDSLFITQKPVPKPVRSGKRQRYSVRSSSISPRLVEESEDDLSSSSSPDESSTDKKRRRKKFRLPKYSFPFLPERKWKLSSTLSVQQNIKLHNSVMGGFFKCVQEQQLDHQRGHDLQPSLPTLDQEGECLSPLSEEEEERSEDEDIKVVERRSFLARLKAKCSKPWYTPEETDTRVKQQRRMRVSNASQEMSQGKQNKVLQETSTRAPISKVTLSSDTGSSNDVDPVCRVPPKRGTRDKCLTSDRSIPAHTETEKIKPHLTRGSQKGLFQEEKLCSDSDSDATVCAPLQGSPMEDTQNGSRAVTEAPADDLTQTGVQDEPESQNLTQSFPDVASDNNSDSVFNKKRVKKKNKEKRHCEYAEEEKGRSYDEPEGLHAAASVHAEAEVTPSPCGDDKADPPASQASDEPELKDGNWSENRSHDDNILRQEERVISDAKHMKKKRKQKSAAENVSSGMDGNSESDVRLEDLSVKKKKKKKRSAEEEDGVEQLQSTEAAELLNHDAETQRKKKKRKKEKRIDVTEAHEEEEAPEQSEGAGNILENTGACHETSRYEKKRKKHKKKKHSASNDAAQVGEEDSQDVSLSNDFGTLEENTDFSVKKQKKKKKHIDISYTPDKNVDNAENSQETMEDLKQDTELVPKKKKERGKMSEMYSRNVSEDAAAQSDHSVSVWKKEKKSTSSFLVTDSEEGAQSHHDQRYPAGSDSAEKPDASAGEFDTGSAETAGRSCDGGRKKKKKRRKMESVEKGLKPDFEEPSKTCEIALPDGADTEVKKKKKHRGTESESVTPMEGLDNTADAGCFQTDEAVMVKKKKKKKKKCEDEPCPEIQESPSTATEGAESKRATLNANSSVSAKKKGKLLTSPLAANGKHDHRTTASHESSQEPLSIAEHPLPTSETPGNQELTDVKDKKKKKKAKSIDDVLLSESAGREVQSTKKNKKKERNNPTTVPEMFQTSSSDSVLKKKPHKAKRRLLNPSEDFLT